DEMSEQYSLGCLVYLLLTGRYYLDFSFEQLKAWQQIATQPPRPFAATASAPWLEAERLVNKALSKDPRDRWPTVSAFADNLAASLDAPELGISDEALLRGKGVAIQPTASLGLLLHDILAEIGPDSGVLQNSARAGAACSVHSGASGIAYGLL